LQESKKNRHYREHTLKILPEGAKVKGKPSLGYGKESWQAGHSERSEESGRNHKNSSLRSE
jgi:hypothetical protein